MPGSEVARIIRFGVFEVELHSRELHRNGLKVKLQEQPFQILALLLEHPGEVVTREELRRRLWPADTFVDFEHSLNTAIKRLRETLGDSADTPVFIETLPRRGYRFLMPVRRNGEPSIASQPAPLRLPGPMPGWSMRFLLLLAALGALVVTTHLGQRLWSGYSARPTTASLSPMKVVPFTTFPGAEVRPHFSPDGKQIAFVSEPENARTADLYVKLIGGENPLKLVQGVGIDSVTAWSPDGRYVAFGRCGGGCGIYMVPALGGAERKLADEGGCGGVGLSWSPDGKFLTFARKLSDDPWSIFLFGLETHKYKRLTVPPPHTIGDHIPAFSPDGRRLAFRRVSSPGVTDIYVVPAEGGEPHRVTFDRTFVGGLAWTADSKSIVFSSSRLGTTGLWRVAASGGAVEAIAVAGPRADHPAVSPQGNRLAYTEGSLHGEIWRMELNKLGKPRSPAPFSSSWGEYGPQFSPDGKKIVFYSSRSGAYFEIWTVDSDGSNPVQLTSAGVLSGTPRWSPDGRFIVFDSRRGDHSQIFVMDADGSPVRQMTYSDFENSVPNWSRDGKWIYFGSNRSGSWQLWKVPSSGGDPIRVTRNRGFFAVESPNGSLIYYAKEDPDGIWQIPASGGEEKQVLNVPLASWGDWAVLDHGIYFIKSEGPNAHATVRFYSFATRKVSTVATVDKAIPPEMPDFDVSPDGKSILYGQVEKSVDIMLVENFH